MDDLLDHAFGTQQGVGAEIQLSVDEVERAFVLIARVAAGAGLVRFICRSVNPVSPYPERWFLRVRGDLP